MLGHFTHTIAPASNTSVATASRSTCVATPAHNANVAVHTLVDGDV